jgi:predicted Zn-dependent peptidase
MKKICVLLLLAASLTGATRASQTDSSALTTLKQSNDRLVHFSLNNGMNCLLKEDHSAPVVSIQIWVGSGSIHEGEWLGAGLSHYVEHMVFKGTPHPKAG